MDYAILVNTTDRFEDCWYPFFNLFKTYWPDFKGKIFLNTETKTFSFPGINIVSVQNNRTKLSHNVTWSECLIRALNFIDSEIILYMQEDYFIKDSVQNDLVDRYVALMKKNKEIGCIHLTDQAVIQDELSSEYDPTLYRLKMDQRYKVSCQAALWKKEVLLSYLRPYENAWQFEEFGSKRANRKNHNKLYVIDNNWIKLNKFEIIPYVFTGIIKGRWNKEVVELFREKGIEIDYNIRGFVQETLSRSFKQRLINKLKYLLVLVRYEFERIL